MIPPVVTSSSAAKASPTRTRPSLGKSLKDMIDFELKTSEDYVNNMDIKEKLAQRFNQLQSKLEAIENVYLIMKNIPVPVSTEDKNSLKNLKSKIILFLL